MKARILEQLTQASKQQLSTRASVVYKASPKDVEQLTLDLIVYRWISKHSHMPTDVKNIDEIISAIGNISNDEFIKWSTSLFATQEKTIDNITLPPRNDSRVEVFSDLNLYIKTAIDYRERYPKEAVNALQDAIKICQEMNLDLCEAILLKELGDQFFYNMSRYRDASACYQRAATWIFPAYGCIASSAIVYDDWGTLNTETGKFASAAENYKQAARLWEQLANTTPSGSNYRGLAGREYMRAGEALRAAGDFVNAQEIMVSYGIKQLRAWAIENDSYDELIRNLIIVANFQRDLGENTKALNTLISAREACNYQKDPLLNAKVWGELAITYNALGQTSNANEALRKQKIEIKKAASDGESAIWKLTNTSSHPQDVLKNLQVKAERGARAYQQMQDLEKAAAIWQKLANYYDKSRMSEQQIVCLRSLATILDLQKKSEESLRVRETAIKTAMKIDKKALAAEIVQDMIQSFIDANQLENALEGFTELAPIVEQTGNVRGLAKVLEGRGLLLSNNNLHEAAVQDFKSAQKQYLEKVGDPWAAGMVALKLAASQKALNQNESAVETLEAALLEIEKNYSRENISPGMDEERSNVVKDIYFFLTSLLVSTGKIEKAENLLRKANVYLWLGELMERLKNDSDPAIHEFAISVNILKPLDSNDNVKIPGESRLLADNWADIARACWMIERQNPVSYNALPVNPLEIFKNRFQLPRDSLIIEYLITDTSTFIFVCGYGKAVCREVSNQKNNIENAVSILRKTLRSCEQSLSAGIRVPPIKDWQESSFLEIKAPLSELYSLLILPVKKDISNRTRLIFVLPNELSGIPMHALLTSDERGVPRFLIDDFEISYIGRNMFYDLISRESRGIDSSSDRLAIFADPYNELKGAQEEARNIQSIYFNSQKYVGAKATVANFKRELNTASIIHIAVHHKIDPNPGNFELLLAPDSNSSGSIKIDELSDNNNSRLALVVLSACDSIASSDPVSLGTSRAAEIFSLIGARSVLGGLWKVSDQAASHIMCDFYRWLSKGKSRSEAIRLAQKAVIESKEYAHPFYWACFALYGNPR